MTQVEIAEKIYEDNGDPSYEPKIMDFEQALINILYDIEIDLAGIRENLLRISNKQKSGGF